VTVWPLRIFIGYDKREIAAYHVLAHSILSRASMPVTICPLNRENLKGIYTRERTDMESTDFSMSRFLVPYLSGYEGMSIFMDCDMLCLADIAELVILYIRSRRGESVHCVQHDYTPKAGNKFLNQAQTIYPMKNWSSLMIFDNNRCRNLTPAVINGESGLFLHQFKWADSIGSIPKSWNWLCDEYDGLPDDLKILHYTLGGPWFPETQHCTGAALWRSEAAHLDSLR